MREFDPAELVGLIKDMAVAGELPSSNLPQLRQLLLCVFGLLFASAPQQQQQQLPGSYWRQGGAPASRGSGQGAAPDTPSSQLRAAARSATPGGGTGGFGASASGVGGSTGGATSIKAQLLLRELRQVPLLPVFGRPGLLVAAQGGATNYVGRVFGAERGGPAGPAAAAAAGCVGADAKVYFPLNLQQAVGGGQATGSMTLTPSRCVHLPLVLGVLD